jgi:hypothetical protein
MSDAIQLAVGDGRGRSNRSQHQRNGNNQQEFRAHCSLQRVMWVFGLSTWNAGYRQAAAPAVLMRRESI